MPPRRLTPEPKSDQKSRRSGVPLLLFNESDPDPPPPSLAKNRSKSDRKPPRHLREVDLADQSGLSPCPVKHASKRRTRSMSAVDSEKRKSAAVKKDQISIPVTATSAKHCRRSSATPSISLQDSAEEESENELDDSQLSEEESEFELCSRLGALALSSPPSSSAVAWDWTASPARKKAPQAFFRISSQLSCHLTSRDQKDGYIYAFKAVDARGRGYIKVGLSENHSTRMKAHKRCYGVCEQIYPADGEKGVPVKHVYRVERLIHAELVEFAMCLKRCPREKGGHKGHGEWFDVDEDLGRQIIDFWCGEFSTSRESMYEQRWSSGALTWKLKQMRPSRLAELCTPVINISSVISDEDEDSAVSTEEDDDSA